MVEARVGEGEVSEQVEKLDGVDETDEHDYDGDQHDVETIARRCVTIRAGHWTQWTVTLTEASGFSQSLDNGQYTQNINYDV